MLWGPFDPTFHHKHGIQEKQDYRHSHVQRDLIDYYIGFFARTYKPMLDNVAVSVTQVLWQHHQVILLLV